MRIAILSDTHNLLRPELPEKLTGCDLIVHAGDFNTVEILKSLERFAPVVGVRGNCDRGVLSELLPERAEFSLGSRTGFAVHDIRTLPGDFDATRYGLVVYGHSHQPSMHEENGTVYLNPGSAGPRRFSLPVSIALLEIDEGIPKPRMIILG